jgi:hypothetical protein
MVLPLAQTTAPSGLATGDRRLMGSRGRRALLAVAVLAVGVLVAVVAVRGRQIGAVVSAVLQGLTVVVSVYGGVVFSREGNEEAVKAAAVKSVRRVLVNYESLGRLGSVIERLRADLTKCSPNGIIVDLDLVDLSLSGLSDLVVEQIASADIAVRDWRDLAPADVDAELAAYTERRASQS